MSAYLNMINLKGIKVYADLLACSKQKINSLKISQADTKILWASIQTARLKSSNSGLSRSIEQPLVKRQKFPSKRLESVTKAQPPLPEVSYLNDSFFTDSFFEISKYQIKFNDSELKSFINNK